MSNRRNRETLQMLLGQVGLNLLHPPYRKCGALPGMEGGLHPLPPPHHILGTILFIDEGAQLDPSGPASESWTGSASVLRGEEPGKTGVCRWNQSWFLTLG